MTSKMKMKWNELRLQIKFRKHFLCLGCFFVFSFFSGHILSQELRHVGESSKNIPDLNKCVGLAAASEPKEESNANSYSSQIQISINQEIAKAKDILERVEKVHKTLVDSFKDYPLYREVELEDSIIRKTGGTRANYRVVASFYYSKEGSVDCVTLAAIQRPIQQENQWTHRVIRFHKFDVSNIEVSSKRYNYERTRLLVAYPREDRLQVVRSAYSLLRKALYKLDIELSSRNYYRTRINNWQTDF